jgi:decaprenylphospho-beta-D-ribofuranose 2-oxidase
MKTRWYQMSAVFLLTTGLILFFIVQREEKTDPLVIQDVGRLDRVKVLKIVRSNQQDQFIAIIKQAKEKGLKISIAGAKHSQGGHSIYPDSVHLDMTSFNQILDINKEEKTIRVQSGATWKQVQEAANDHGLSVKVMQSSNIFTVGGSLSVNAHGRDVRFGPMIETINSFRLLTADAQILNVSREENPHLFRAAIGGYGLLGLILDIDIQLTDDVVYEVRHHPMDYTQYPEYFTNEILGNKNTHLHIARLSTAPSSFLTEMYASNYTQVTNAPDLLKEASASLNEEENIQRNKIVLGLARRSGWGKERIWELQKVLYSPGKVEYMRRNNAMRPEVLFLEYFSEKDTDLLQEYFIPVAQFVPFVDEMRHILREDKMNVFNITVRYVPQNQEAMLSYAHEDMFAVVLLINHGLSEAERKKAALTTQKLVDAVLKLHGTYYLPYQLYPTDEQFHQSYPHADAFFRLKLQHDPKQMFMNRFYERYYKPRADG